MDKIRSYSTDALGSEMSADYSFHLSDMWYLPTPGASYEGKMIAESWKLEGMDFYGWQLLKMSDAFQQARRVSRGKSNPPSSQKIVILTDQSVKEQIFRLRQSTVRL